MNAARAGRGPAGEVDAATEKDKQSIMDAGVTFVSLSEDEQATLEDTMATVGEEWATELDAAGEPGTEVLNAFRKALADQ